MFKCESRCVCACGFVEISGNTGNYQRNLQQCHVALVSVTCSCAIYKCVQRQMTGICLRLGYLSSFSLAGTELFVLVHIFFPQREGFTLYHWGGDKTEVPTCPVGGGGVGIMLRAKSFLSLQEIWCRLKMHRHVRVWSKFHLLVVN